MTFSRTFDIKEISTTPNFICYVSCLRTSFRRVKQAGRRALRLLRAVPGGWALFGRRVLPDLSFRRHVFRFPRESHFKSWSDGLFHLQNKSVSIYLLECTNLIIIVHYVVDFIHELFIYHFIVPRDNPEKQKICACAVFFPSSCLALWFVFLLVTFQFFLYVYLTCVWSLPIVIQKPPYIFGSSVVLPLLQHKDVPCILLLIFYCLYFLCK